MTNEMSVIRRAIATASIDYYIAYDVWFVRFFLNKKNLGLLSRAGAQINLSIDSHTLNPDKRMFKFYPPQDTPG